MRRIRSSLEQLFVKYESALTKPSFKNFTAMAKGWVVCSGRHSISRVIQFMPVSYRHRQLKRWCPGYAPAGIQWWSVQCNGSGDASRSESIASEQFGGRPQ